MPKSVDYPRASLKASLRLAQAVQDLGGSCSVAMAAEKMGKKVSGAFKALVGAGTKYGVLSHKVGRLTVTTLFRDYRLAYTALEQERVLRRAFLGVPLFHQIAERFKGQKLPVDHFEKLLIKEFEVPEDVASRVAMYFIDGSKEVGVLSADHTITSDAGGPKEIESAAEHDEEAPGSKGGNDAHAPDEIAGVQPTAGGQPQGYSVRIFGPGIDSIIAINEEDDIAIVEIMLKKVRKRIQEMNISSSNREEKEA